MNLSKGNPFGFVMKIIKSLFILSLHLTAINVAAQSPESFVLKAEDLKDERQNDKAFELGKSVWKYRLGDDPNWANPQTDDSAWDKIEGTYIAPGDLPPDSWNGRAWLRLRLNVDENLVNRTLALIAFQSGASEIYLDGEKIAIFGTISDERIGEYNPSRLPIPFKFETAGEHVLAVRFASRLFPDFSGGKAVWMTNGGIYPGFSISIIDANNVSEVIENYVFVSSMRIGFLFIGVLLALALLHFLLYLFYRVERANLFYSIYAASFGLFLLANNIIAFGHQSILISVVLKIIASALIAADFTGLLAFLHVAFGRKLGKFFWILTGLWTINVVMNAILLNKIGNYIFFTNALVGLSFTFSIIILIFALRERRSGAWILMGGVQILILGMTLSLLVNLNVVNIPRDFSVLAELAIILGVPIAVSIFLARNFARTNRDLKTQLAQVEELSLQKIEQERTAAELRAENDRRAKELEEARQLQLSMLPRKLPVIPNLEIAAYMKPATEVGGDYYDFHVGEDGTLTVAVGDATGHGLKAGTVVTATKGLFNNLAPAPDIPDTLKQISRSLKAMNLRGLFMALTILKIKENRVKISAAGMPAALIYRSATRTVEEISQRALPLGSVGRLDYREQEISLAEGDRIVLMSDGFPEMFNEQNELFGYDQAEKIILENPKLAPPELIESFLDAAKKWAGDRPQDDDVTFVVLQFKR